MNKDVIYIEPEDDITDIIGKIEKSKEKIVALVPPKKAGVFRSVVNIKLIAKAGTNSEKKVVLVTTDPSILKLAGAAKLPVTKNLQSAPSVPTEEPEIEETEKEDLVEESDGTVEAEEDVEESEPSEEEKDDDEEDEEDEEKEEKKEEKKKAGKSEKKAKKSGNKFVSWFKEHKKLAIFSGIGILVLIIVLIWALFIAPSVAITVEITATSNNFSENVSFKTKMTEEDASEGKFYLEEKKIESTAKVEFEATGQKNVGEKASGEVIVYTYIQKEGGITPIKAGSIFTISGLSYVSSDDATLSWDGKDIKDCENFGQVSIMSGCLVSRRVKVTAAEPGTKYNISASNNGWNTVANVAVYSDSAMSGGTDSMITVVSQADVDKAKGELTTSNEEENKKKLFEELSDDVMKIDSSFKQVTGDAVSTPAVGEEVKEGEKPVLEATTTASIYVIDKTKVEEFITEKAKLGENQKIYEMKDPFIENFMETDGGYTGKLKTSYLAGPKLTVSSVVDLVKGKGLGDAQHMLKDIDGVIDVHMDPSFPWVAVIPDDTNKITVNLEIKDQNGNSVEQKVLEDNNEETKEEDEKKEEGEKTE
ncbi:hypothetical protein IKG33_00535 [Candidatus Saccharibacteria bacterium]|nr:hypothetical protein [Candidatus Saccharibacteria bacterium]